MPQLFPIGNVLSMRNDEERAHYTVATWQHVAVPLGDNLRHWMKLRGMQQADLARKARIARSTVSRYINGEKDDKRPSAKHIEKLAAALDVSSDVLMGSAQEPLSSESPLESAAAKHQWDVPTSRIREVMAIARAEAATTDQPAWYWSLRIKEILEDPAPPRLPSKPVS